MKKISVIIPAHNVEAYIEQCARSVINQTLKDIECIFIDDGSTDRTGDILDNIKKKCPDIIVVHQENKGLYRTREIGLSIATGEYVGWVDADDFIEPDMYEVLYEEAVKNDSELVICDYVWTRGKNNIKKKWFREYTGIVDTTFVEQNSQVWNKIVKRGLLLRLSIGKFFESCFDEIYIRVLIEAKNPITIQQQFYHYRVSENTMSSSYKNVDHYKRFVEASRHLKVVMRTFEDNEYWNDYFDYRIIYYFLVTMIVAANAGNKNEYDLNRIELLKKYPRYSKNQHYWKILKRNFGSVKAFIVGGVIPKHYYISKLLCRIAFK